VQDIKQILDTAAAFQVYLRQQRKANTEQLKIAEYFLRAERRLGEIIKAAKAIGQIDSRRNLKKGPEVDHDDLGGPSLKDAGITKDLSSRAQRIALVPEDEFEKRISQGREAGKLSRNLFTPKPSSKNPPGDNQDSEPEITREMLSPSDQIKFDKAIRNYQQKLAQAFKSEVNSRIDELIGLTIGPALAKREAEARLILNAHKGLMTRKEFNRIRMCLHDDRTPSAEEKHNAFIFFTRLEKVLLSAKEAPSEFPKIPSSLAEWDILRKQAAEARKQKTKPKSSAISRR